MGKGQLRFEFKTHGGYRRRAGRKRRSRKVNHTRRPRIDKHTPVHVTLRVVPRVAKLRKPKLWQVLRRAFVAGCKQDGFAISQFSIQRNHIHLLCEAHSPRHLSRGMNGFNSRLARAINGRLGQSGKVFADRYHERALGSPRELRHALAYVLMNARHHGEALELAVDHLSSARYFDGWIRGAEVPAPGTGPPVVAPPTSWLLRVGWRRHGLLDPHELPGRRH